MVKTKSCICIIPARGGSKGLPRKNTLKLDGTPLIARAVHDVIAAGVCDQVVVTTDDDEIKDIALAAGADVPFVRPSDVSDDLATTEDTLQHALQQSEIHYGTQFDTGLFVTCTDVFRKVENIRKVVEILHSNDELDSVFVGKETHKNFWEANEGGRVARLRPWMKEYASRQVRRKLIQENTGLGCASRAALWRQGRRIGDKVHIVIDNDEKTDVDIHSKYDLALANLIVGLEDHD